MNGCSPCWGRRHWQEHPQPGPRGPHDTGRGSAWECRGPSSRCRDSHGRGKPSAVIRPRMRLMGATFGASSCSITTMRGGPTSPCLMTSSGSKQSASGPTQGCSSSIPDDTHRGGDHPPGELAPGRVHRRPWAARVGVAPGGHHAAVGRGLGRPHAKGVRTSVHTRGPRGQNTRADARIRTADPFITRDSRGWNPRSRGGMRRHAFPCKCTTSECPRVPHR
jgi:hypothetical protein